MRDLRLERTRSACVVLAIAIGIAAFGTVLSSYAILVRELNRGYLATNPASAVLRTDKVDDALLAKVEEAPGVGDVEARRVLRGRIKAGPAEWRSLTLFVVKDYGDIRISRLVPQAGAWPPATGEILIERDALQVARARIGDRSRSGRPRGSERTLALSGSVHDVGQAQARMENIVYGYVGAGHAGAARRRAVPRPADPGRRRQHARRGARPQRGGSASRPGWRPQGHPVHRMDVPKPGQHPHADLMGMLLLSMVAFGLFALVLSGILVVNLLTALLASQVRQIGVMKAVGGTRWPIARIYLAQALLLGVAAWVVAVPLGIWGSRVLCRYLAVFLNFDIASFAVPAWVYLLEALVGLLVPLLAAAYPVARGTRISVREALADYGVAESGFGTTAFDRALASRRGHDAPAAALAAQRLSPPRAAGVDARDAFRGRRLLHVGAQRARVARPHHRPAVRLREVRPHASASPACSRSRRSSAPCAGRPGVARAEGWVTTEATLVPAGRRAARERGDPRAARRGTGRRARHGRSVPGSLHAHRPAGGIATSWRPTSSRGGGLRQGDTNALLVNNTLAARDPRSGWAAT